MIEIYCDHCGDRIEIANAQELGGSVQIKIIPCGCPDVPCDPKTCEHIKDAQEAHAKEVSQLQEDVASLDKIIENVKKATEGDE